tara:strand:- start:192 stop:668 length:477 start_codon:yes stop_codon:yes gene_type:complete
MKTSNFQNVKRVDGFRSGLEAKIANELSEVSVTFEYEPHSISFLRPSRNSKYTPDFLLPNGIYIEVKGRFVTSDRQKHLLIKEQHPNLDVRFVFSNPHTYISKKSTTTYAMWCDRHGFKYAKSSIPKEWIDETLNTKKMHKQHDDKCQRKSQKKRLAL